MTTIIAAIIGVFGPIAAVLITFRLNRRAERKRVLRASKLLGTWRSAWQTNSSSGNTWVTEDVDIVVKQGELVLTNNHNSSGYVWTADGRIVGHTYLAGTWQSTVKDASQGVFTLMLTDSKPSMHGDALVGFFLGPNDNQFSNFGAWVLTRHSENIEAAKIRLRAAGPALPDVFR